MALADILVTQGRLRDAVRTYERSLQFVEAQGTHARHGEAILHVGLGELYFEQGDQARTEEHLQQAEDLAGHAWSPVAETRLYTLKARIEAGQGEFETALDLLNQAEQVADQAGRSDLHSLAALRTRVWLRQGRSAQALAWVRERRLSADDDCSYRTESEQITLARIRIAEYESGRAEQAIHEAIDLLARLLQEAEAGGRDGSVIELLVLQALAYHAQNDIHAASRALMRALAMAQPHGYVRVFADEGRPMHTLLAECLTQGADPTYVTQLLAAISVAEDGDFTAPDANQLLVEPLSKRELQVLQLLDAGYTNQAVADELVIAVSTVKKHVNNIFGKLGVTSRTQAVSHARKLELL